MGCSAVYSDGTTISDASEYVAVSSGSYNLNKEGQYTITYRYTDGSGITSQDVSVSVQVYVNPVSLTAVKSSIEVTAGEYQKVTDIFSKMGLAAVDSRGKSISNAASQVRLQPAGGYQHTGNVFTDTDVNGRYRSKQYD